MCVGGQIAFGLAPAKDFIEVDWLLRNRFLARELPGNQAFSGVGTRTRSALATTSQTIGNRKSFSASPSI